MIPTSQLTETINLDLGNIVQIPDLPPAVVGVCGWRGEVLWLVDLAYALQLPPLLGPDYQASKCSVLRVTIQQQMFGVLVTEVQQLIRCDRQAIIPDIPAQFKATVAPFISGQYLLTPQDVLLSINLAAMLDTLKKTG